MHYTHVWFLSFMPPVVFHYSVLPLGISTAQKCQFVPKVKVNSRFLSFMPPVVFHYSVLPLGISTAQKCQFVPKVKVNSLFKKMIISGMTVIDFATQICPMHRQQYQIVVTLNQRHT